MKSKKKKKNQKIQNTHKHETVLLVFWHSKRKLFVIILGNALTQLQLMKYNACSSHSIHLVAIRLGRCLFFPLRCVPFIVFCVKHATTYYTFNHIGCANSAHFFQESSHRPPVMPRTPSERHIKPNHNWTIKTHTSYSNCSKLCRRWNTWSKREKKTPYPPTWYSFLSLFKRIRQFPVRVGFRYIHMKI